MSFMNFEKEGHLSLTVCTSNAIAMEFVQA